MSRVLVKGLIYLFNFIFDLGFCLTLESVLKNVLEKSVLDFV